MGEMKFDCQVEACIIPVLSAIELDFISFQNYHYLITAWIR